MPIKKRNPSGKDRKTPEAAQSTLGIPGNCWWLKYWPFSISVPRVDGKGMNNARTEHMNTHTQTPNYFIVFYYPLYRVSETSPGLHSVGFFLFPFPPHSSSSLLENSATLKSQGGSEFSSE
jgi:hypothetical protein